VSGLRSRVLTGLAWKAGSQSVLQVCRFVVALVLARLLLPHDFGLAAMVVVFSGIVVLITDSALGVALIQRRDLSEEERSSVFWVGAGLGLVCTLAGIGASGPLASFYGEPKVRALFVVLSISFFVGSLGTAQSALLARDMNFRLLELRQIAATIAGAIIGVSLALGGFGAWAIVGQQVATVAASTVLLWVFSPWRPSLRFSLAALKGLSSFTGNVFAQNVVYFAGRNLDKVMIGRFIGAQGLGVYALAYNVMLAPFNQIAAPLQQVLFPAFAQIQDQREKLTEMWIRVARLVGALAIPSLVGLVVVAPDFVDAVLGRKWHQSSLVLRILAVVGLVQALQTLNGEILLALGRARTFLRFTLVWFAANTIAFVAGLHWGIVGVAVCYALASLVVEPLNAYITADALGVSVWRFVRAFNGVGQAAAIMGVIVLVARQDLIQHGFPPAQRLLACVLLGIVAFAAACAWRAPEVVDEIRGLRRRREAQPLAAAA